MARDAAPSASERLLRTLLPAVCTPSLSSGLYGRPVLPRLEPLDRATAIASSRLQRSSSSETVQSPPLSAQPVKRPRREVWEDDDEVERKRRHSSACRKPTYLARKEERDELLRQISDLQAHVDLLQQHPEILAWKQSASSLSPPERANQILREAVRSHQYSVVRAHSVLTSIKTQHEMCPLESYIKLDKDADRRYETLRALKPQKLLDARRLVENRLAFMDPTKEFVEMSRFSTDKGVYCAARFDVTPLEGATSVKHAHDIMCLFIRTMETSVLENASSLLGYDAAVRDSNIVQRRLVVARPNPNGVQTESNFVMFADYESGDARGQEFGIIAVDFVNEDELYPYTPDQCVRQDANVAMTFQPHRCKVRNKRTGKEEEHLVVMMTRWVLLRLHPGKFPIPRDNLEALKSHVECVSDAMLDAMKTHMLHEE